jgi:hypothetical protein
MYWGRDEIGVFSYRNNILKIEVAGKPVHI